MFYRITDAQSSARLSSQVAFNQQRLADAQERVATGKRINRPSDDPSGAGAVLRARAAQSIVDGFRRSVGTVKDFLTNADTTLESYQNTLDRVSALLTQGASDTTPQTGRDAIAAELQTLSRQILNVANTRVGDEYLFGGTRQTVAPFDASGAPAPGATAPQVVQIEPDAPPVAKSVTADAVFSDANGTIFQSLTAAINALRGTGDPTADTATIRAQLDRIKQFSDLANAARAQIGANLNQADAASARLDSDFLALEQTAQRYESADLAESAVELTSAQNALNATIQSAAHLNARTLIDLLG
jgi:flagellar hook-associated protein 3 FlgL